MWTSNSQMTDRLYLSKPPSNNCQSEKIKCRSFIGHVCFQLPPTEYDFCVYWTISVLVFGFLTPIILWIKYLTIPFSTHFHLKNKLFVNPKKKNVGCVSGFVKQCHSTCPLVLSPTQAVRTAVRSQIWKIIFNFLSKIILSSYQF
jgi:hypothetical protein